MAEDRKRGTEDEDEVEVSPAATKSNKTTILIAVGVGVLLLVVVVVFFLIRGSKESLDEVVDPSLVATAESLKIEGATDEDEFEEGEEALGAIFPLETFVVNLSGDKEFLRCQMQVEFFEREVPARFYSRLVPIRDALIELIASRRAAELSSAAGRESLKDDVRQVVNELMRKEIVKQVYFTQFVIQ